MLPDTVNGFELEDSGSDTFLYTNDDVDVTVSASRAPDGSGGTEWVVSAVAPGSAGGTIAKGLSGKSEAKKVAVDYMEGFPTGGSDDAGNSNGETVNNGGGAMDETMNDGGDDGGRGRGVLSSVARTVVAPDADEDEGLRDVATRKSEALLGGADGDGDDGDDDGGGGLTRSLVAPDADEDEGTLDILSRKAKSAESLVTETDDDDDDGPSAFERFSGDRGGGSSGLFDATASDDSPSALERLSDDRDRGTSPLFDDTMQGSSGPSVFDELGGGDDGPSAFEKLSDDSGRSSSGLLDGTMGGSDGPGAFDELDSDRDSGSRLEKLSEAEDSSDLYGDRR
jgi:hypothetical protein